MSTIGWFADIRFCSHYRNVPKYEPLDSGTPLEAVRSDLVAFQWNTNGIVADFILPDDDEHLRRVSFDGQCIVRLLDEMPLSTEKDDTPDEGRVPNHFAYRVEGALFARPQSEIWREVIQSVAHYQFVTGGACMDVLSGATPSFSVIPRRG